MIKLTKTKATEWMGNGMGTQTAEWCVKGAENIIVFKTGHRWVAQNEDTCCVLCRAWDKKDLITKLETLLT